MKEFSKAELVRNLGDVTHAASQGPIAITHHSKPRFVMMSIEAYEAVRALPEDPRRVYRTSETPEELKAVLLPQLEAFIAGEGDYDD